MPAAVPFEKVFDEISKTSPEILEKNYIIEDLFMNCRKIFLICKLCGFERYQNKAVLLTGAGCKKCSSVKRGISDRLTKEQWLSNVLERYPENIKKFNYDLVQYERSIDKIQIKCNTCFKIFNQTPNDHYNGKGCPHCCNRITTTESFVERVISRFPENKLLFDYSQVKYISDTTPIKIGCKKCGKYFHQNPTKHYQGHGCNLHNGNNGGFRKESSGYLYVSKWCSSNGNFIKVGISSVSPTSRARSQKSESSFELQYSVLYSTYSTDGGQIMSLERSVLNNFKEHSRHTDKSIFPDGWTETFPEHLEEEIINYIQELVNE